MRFRMILAFVAVSSVALAQQIGDVNRNYLINGQGGGLPSPVASSVPACASCAGFQNNYGTTDPGAPILWVTSGQASIGWLTSATNSVDIGPANLTFLLDGTDPNNPLAPLFATNAAGAFAISIALPAAVEGASRFFAMAHLAASSPDGFWVSQTHEASFGINNLSADGYTSITGSATVVTLGDDDSVLVPLGMTFSFYSGTYSQVYINSNGNLTFGAGSTTFSVVCHSGWDWHLR